MPVCLSQPHCSVQIKCAAHSGAERPGSSPSLPSQVLFEMKYNGQDADVWSCGVSLYVMLTGVFPFSRPTDEVGAPPSAWHSRGIEGNRIFPLRHAKGHGICPLLRRHSHQQPRWPGHFHTMAQARGFLLSVS